MAGTVKKLQFSEGTDVGAPTDLNIQTSSSEFVVYADDTAFVTAEGAATAGNCYLNSTTNKLRVYIGGAWRNWVPESDSSDATKTFLPSVSGNTTGVASTLAFADTTNKTHTFPDSAGTVVQRDSTDTGSNRLQNKELDDSTVAIVDNSDTTKKFKFQASGISTATTRTATVPDKDFTIAGIANETFTGTTTISTALIKTSLDVEDPGAGTNKISVVSPTLAGDFTLTLPGITDTVVTRTNTETLSNKTLATPTVTGTATIPTALIKTALHVEDPGAGTNKVIVQSPTLSGDYTLTLPTDDGNSGQVLTTDGSGVLSWSSVSSGLSNSVNDVQNLGISTSVAANALTINITDAGGSTPSAGSSVKVGFRSSTAATGTYSVITITSALSTVISSGSTAGHTSGVPEYIYVYLINNAGTAEVAWSSTLFDRGSIISTTAEGGAGAADSALIMYSTTARSNVGFQLVGRLKSSQTTAGTWASNMTEVVPGNVFGDNLTPTGMSDITATKRGYKNYLHGTTYANGNAPTITTNRASTSIKRGSFVPYQMQDGSWRLNIDLVVEYTTNTSVIVTIAGITFKSDTNYYQALAYTAFAGGAIQAYCNPGGNTISADTSISSGRAALSGDIELDSKPTWAY